MRKFLVMIPIAVLAIGGSTACATKKFVRTSVGEVNDKVDSMGRSLEQTQERQRVAEGRITEVDTKAGAAAQAAQAAQNSANQADTKAAAAGTAASAAGTAASAAGSAANAAAMKAEAVDKATKRLVYEVVLSEDEGNFKFAKTILPDEAKAKLISWWRRSRPIRRVRTSRSKGTPTTSAIRRRTTGSVSSAPNRSSGISTNSTRSRCSRST
jgi:hypothetical protein